MLHFHTFITQLKLEDPHVRSPIPHTSVSWNHNPQQLAVFTIPHQWQSAVYLLTSHNFKQHLSPSFGLLECCIAASRRVQCFINNFNCEGGYPRWGGTEGWHDAVLQPWLHHSPILRVPRFQSFQCGQNILYQTSHFFKNSQFSEGFQNNEKIEGACFRAYRQSQ